MAVQLQRGAGCEGAASPAVKNRPSSALASPTELAVLLRALAEDVEAIAPMYARLHSMGLESERRESVHVSGGDPGDEAGTLAVESDLARRRREYARWVVKEVIRASKGIDRVRQGLERNVGPGLGFRQSQSIGSGAIVTTEQFAESLRRQSERLKEGVE